MLSCPLRPDQHAARVDVVVNLAVTVLDLCVLRAYVVLGFRISLSMCTLMRDGFKDFAVDSQFLWRWTVKQWSMPL